MPDQGACHLFTLPPELIGHVIQQFDSVTTIGSFVRSCRYAHDCFAGDKQRLLLRVLSNQLGPVLIDARFLYRFPCANYVSPEEDPLGNEDYCDELHTAAELYMAMLDAGDDIADADIQELVSLCHTLHEFNLVVDVYAAAQQHWFGSHEEPLSRTERLRVLRALYRRQIVYNAWAPMKRDIGDAHWMTPEVVAMSNTSGHRGRRLGLYAAFTAWQLNQLDQVNYFIAELCRAFCNFEEQPSTSPIADKADFGNLLCHTHELVRYLRCHPELVEAALDATKPPLTHRPQDDGDTDPLGRWTVAHLYLPCLVETWQTSRARALPDPVRDSLYDVQQGQDVQDDGQETSSRTRRMIHFVRDDVESPPFGWVDGLDGQYTNWFGEALFVEPATEVIPYFSDLFWDRADSMNLWTCAGFTLWDKWRVEAIKELPRMKGLSTGWIVG